MRVLAVCACALAGFAPVVAAQESACRGLDEATKRVVSYLVDNRYGDVLGIVARDPDDERPELRMLAANRAKVVPCLLEIYTSGPLKAGVWRHAGPAPADGRRLIDVIRRVDPETGRRLYRERRQGAPRGSSEWVASTLALARLGETDVLPDVASYLENVAAAGAESRRRAAGFVDEALDVLAMRNYVPALPALKKLERSCPWDQILPVYVAQLEGDADLLRLYAGTSNRACFALRCLVWMGRSDVVRKLADAREYPFHQTALAVLEERDW